MKHKVKDIIDFLADLSCTSDISPESDIFYDVGMSGDDFHEMVEAFSKKYSVDMTDYLWYFHCDEEGVSFFKPPYRRVERIPVTPAMLTEFANNGKWKMNYPEHILPSRRYDLILNNVIFIGLLLSLIIGWAMYYWIG
jgi:hypothetical protein